jgi:hypothetical protein
MKNVKLTETLNEFMADGSKFQMASAANKTWKSVWKVDIPFDGQKRFITIEGGVTNVMPAYHQAVINVLVRQIDVEGGAEDVSSEQITVWIRSYISEDEAIEKMKEMRELF